MNLPQPWRGPVALSREIWFPKPDELEKMASREGLVALGGDLSPERLLAAYGHGIFPWSVNPVTWWSPDPRGIFELDGLHVSTSLEKFLKKAPFTYTIDTAFSKVMQSCAKPGPGREESWITPEFITAYEGLHRMGHAHSLEVWQEDRLVGGIYGVAVHGLFAGESMFHEVSNASKAALIQLAAHLREKGFALFDVQVVNPHTQRMGAKRISRKDYMARLDQALARECRF